MASVLGRRLVCCLLNISEAREKDLVEKVAQAAITYQNGGRRKGATVLNIFNDHDYNRSVLTIVASIELIAEVVLSACEQAFSLIDMNKHEGIHPCMGAVDLIPFYPLGEEVGLEDCGREAKALATALTEKVPGTSAFFFGWADASLHRLGYRRKEMGWFRKVPNMTNIRPDIGSPPTSRFGLTGIGASPYVMNCNVTIDTQDLALGREVALAIRESSPGGIPGVQVLALPHEGTVEIACNVESVPQGSAIETESWPVCRIRNQNFCHAPPSLIAGRISELAGCLGVRTKGTALVGFTPLECKQLAEEALSQDVGEFWKKRHSLRM
ncbi:formiminotransferase N-terminal subdomain-containing protein [Trichomycterus rosablanca]|uniref:formiminotransferase N-terminal subdomain-containing protein n=1 Tax=Trichomycterus rosablanca TaxID=2290929 RepID=UPI002F353105